MATSQRRMFMSKPLEKQAKSIVIKDEHKYMDRLTICFGEDDEMRFYLD